MELKPYQQKVIDDLDAYLILTEEQGGAYAKAFTQFWETRLGPYDAATNKGMEPYKDNVPGVPNVCIKVPTAGGKTFIAANALKTIYDHYHFNTHKAVVWLVPGVTILDQTLKNLSNPSHPYRQRINTHFANRVQVYDKAALQQGSNFNAAAVREQLSIFVLSFDTFRSRTKEARKIYQENGSLISHNVAPEVVLEGTDSTALINVIRNLNPLVIVDESHNAETELSVEMLRNLNPSFILDLTATPRNDSNIISFVDALELKKEHMVKLPVIVYNLKDKASVIEKAINLRNKLEKDAREEEKKGGAYIRPIVLFQAQPRTGEEQTTFEKIKEALIQIGIKEEEIKIKTADINELKTEDLFSKTSKVHYIITVNALKEGWDCSFAYVLASLADKSSAVDVEQIVGRILRQPGARQCKNPVLNISFVLTASGRFLDTLDKIVTGLNKAGFSRRDYTVAGDEWKSEAVAEVKGSRQMLLDELSNQNIPSTSITEAEPIEVEKVHITSVEEVDVTDAVLTQILEQATEQDAALQQQIKAVAETGESAVPTEITTRMTTYKIKDVFKEAAKKILLPQFFVKEENLFGQVNEGDDDIFLAKENLLDDFQLSKEDTKLDFESIKAELYKIDLESLTGDQTTPTFTEIGKKFQPALLDYFSGEIDAKAKSQLAGMLFKIMGNLPPITDGEVKKYLKKIVEDLDADEAKEIAGNPYFYTIKIKEKIWKLADGAAEHQFNAWLDTDKIIIKPSYRLKDQFVHKELAPSIAKSLYEREEKLNGLETDMASRLGSLENVLFWHKNPVFKGMAINGFINHYPDFIVVTKAGKIIIIETKGDHLDGSASMAKIRLGEAWARKAGNDYRYYMVFDTQQVQGAITVNEMLNRISNL